MTFSDLAGKLHTATNTKSSFYRVTKQSLSIAEINKDGS
jgi:hypothetical protein